MARSSLPSPKRYARVLLELALAHGVLGEWRGILQDMAAAAANEEFAALLEARGIPDGDKEAAVRAALPAATEVGYNLIMILAKKRALALLPRIEQEFETAADEQEGLQYVEVRTAVPIDDATQEGIAQGLRGFLGKDVRLATRVDPAVLGGMVLRIGDRVIDGSARGRLKALRHSLVLTG